jgi:hypothetical protein
LKQLGDSRNALIERLVAELCGDELPENPADERGEDQDDDDDAIHVADEAEETEDVEEPAQVSLQQFGAELSAALAKWLV